MDQKQFAGFLELAEDERLEALRDKQSTGQGDSVFGGGPVRIINHLFADYRFDCFDLISYIANNGFMRWRNR